MFEKILIANRGDKSSNDGAAPNCTAAFGRKGDFTAETSHV